MNISLSQQIQEVRREIERRKKVNPRLERTRGYRKSELDYHMMRMQAVLKTLIWLQTNPDGDRR